MPHTYTHLFIHAVFSTKNRQPLLDRELRPRMFSYMAEVAANLGARALLMNGAKDHVHMLFVLPPALPLADLIEKVKANSSRWVNKHGRRHGRFAWQAGYAAFSVSQSNAERVRQYINHQEEHHRRRTFQEELLAFLKSHGVAYDPRYVFED